ncbi:uncharacterized protein PFL1_03571 [Pseudozyma flocculosa PF-1]|uniref:Related to protein urg3 n=2 Tax=Pseudozyma flocculosa TaxID=84751 RepID=A0A5C3F800_9BASI|nr:uncharacterized protein PFL1_03571 [Pseudozyma flocculosa PF-1]EPQ28768.1 hypothetical protein PFL1_03571 [Pseudozyma flocculosa PF-1]SPO39451.1 related to protein urg3 [Pseudozyma flocculosa]
MASSTSPSKQVPAPVAYLRSLPSIRERCRKVFEVASTSDGLEYLRYDASRESAVVDFCISIMQRDFGTNYASIPPHGRWRHFDVGPLPRITTLLSQWAGVGPQAAAGTEGEGGKRVDAKEAARRLVDLFIVSVLLDAGAGTKWKYEEKKTGLQFARSEGLAVASLDMFLEGRFCGDEGGAADQQQIGARHKVDARGLLNLSADTLAMDMQVHPESNPMTGLEGRSELLVRLGKAISEDAHGFFSGDVAGGDPLSRRPGNLVNYLAAHPTTRTNAAGKVEVSVPTLWEVLIYGLAPIWPASRTSLEGVAMGDVWPCPHPLHAEEGSAEALVPFHKLSQWMCYSIMEPIEQTLGWTFIDGDDQTGLPEYRNGGLFVDLGVLVPKDSLLAASQPTPVSRDEWESATALPRLEPQHPAIVEWRAMTVILLDRTAEGIRTKLGLSKDQLNLKQVLESATWKGGREIAKHKRPASGGPPIEIISDGTVF